MDDLRKKTDKELQKMEKKLAKIYKEAEKDLTKKWNEYMERAEKRIEKYEKALADAIQSGDKESIAQAEEELKRRREAVLYKDEWYRKMVEQTAEKYSDVNNIAVAYVNDKIPGIYTMNLNGTLQDINSDLGKVGQLGVSFNLVDEHTVRNLVKSDKSLFPQKVINKAKDMKWNLKAINSQVTQGILQGESIPQIQKRLQNVTSMNSAAAIRSARTMCTTAENNGRLSGIKEAEEQGIVYEKQWMATHDDRTRESHAELDGESVPIDEEFSNGLQYPGDPAGDPEEVYNCFVGETKIGANSRVIRTYKHKYEGDLFTIKTASGIQFTCTPNHPILTSRGWIAANRINDGDDLFVTSVSKKPFFVTWSNPNINHVLARFDTIHKFFKVFGRKRTADLGVNFHGDIPTSEVEIVTQKRFLRNNRNTCGGKSINKFFFILADKAAFCKSTFLEHFGRIWQSSLCGIGGKSKSFSLFGRCLRHSKIHSLRPIALLDSGRIQKSYNNGARYAQLLGNSLNGFSGIVFADKVISIDIKFSHCDVFNLQSENGYYFASSIIPQRHRRSNNDIMVIAHNCRCSLVRKLIGFRREDGSVSEVGDIKRYDPHYFDKPQEEQAKESEKEQKVEESKKENDYGITFDYLTNNRESHVVQMQYIPTQETIEKFDTIGIRAVPREQEGKYKIGSVLPESYDWDYEKDISTYYTTGETLGGSSCLLVKIEDDEPLDVSIQKALQGTYEYEGKDIFIVGGNFVNEGEDTNEVIIGNATAIGKIGIYDANDKMPKLSELKIEILEPEKTTLKEVKQNIESVKAEDIKEKAQTISEKSKEELFEEFKEEMILKYPNANPFFIFGELNAEEKKKWNSLK